MRNLLKFKVLLDRRLLLKMWVWLTLGQWIQYLFPCTFDWNTLKNATKLGRMKTVIVFIDPVYVFILEIRRVRSLNMIANFLFPSFHHFRNVSGQKKSFIIHLWCAVLNDRSNNKWNGFALLRNNELARVSVQYGFVCWYAI